MPAVGGGQGVHSSREGGEKPPTAWVQLEGQLESTFSHIGAGGGREEEEEDVGYTVESDSVGLY